MGRNYTRGGGYERNSESKSASAEHLRFKRMLQFCLENQEAKDLYQHFAAQEFTVENLQVGNTSSNILFWNIHRFVTVFVSDQRHGARISQFECNGNGATSARHF